jgi:hypothetical protein
MRPTPRKPDPDVAAFQPQYGCGEIALLAEFWVVVAGQVTPPLEANMKITTYTTYPDDVLESYRPPEGFNEWDLVVSGFWSASPYHSGHIAYFIANPEPGLWTLDGVERHAELDGVTEEDVKEGYLNDDQIQAMWGMTLEEAQNWVYRRIVAICEDAPAEASIREMALVLYGAVQKESVKVVEESDVQGFLS